MIVYKNCRVCGKRYEMCNTQRVVKGVYRWQEVACCPEHGGIYLEQVLKSRAANTQNTDGADGGDE